jgi:hypothetical protein
MREEGARVLADGRDLTRRNGVERLAREAGHVRLFAGQEKLVGTRRPETPARRRQGWS